MIEAQKSIYEFHRKHKFPVSLPLKANKSLDKYVMRIFCKLTMLISKLCIYYWKWSGKKNESFYRLHLITEETAETFIPLNEGNIEKTCDGLGDLTYVVIGTFVSYRLPAKEVIQEICRSNDTKAPRDFNTNVRLRNKGKNFSPPDFKQALTIGRDRLLKERQI